MITTINEWKQINESINKKIGKRLQHLRLAQIYSSLAKEYSALSSDFYYEKSEHILKALNNSNNNKAYYSEDEDVIYFETEVGQISFHTNFDKDIINHKNTIIDNDYIWDNSKESFDRLYDIDPDYWNKKEKQILNKYD